MIFLNQIKLKYFLFSLILLISSCTSLKNQSNLVTSNIRQNKDNNCEEYCIRVSLQLLAQTKEKWQKIDFSDENSIIEFAEFIKKETETFKYKNKTYLKIKKENNNYIILEKDFYSKILNLSKKNNSKFQWKYIFPWIK